MPFNSPEFYSPPFGWVGLEDRIHVFLDQLNIEVKVIVELGVYWGYSFFCWGRLFPDAKVIGIDRYEINDRVEAIQHIMKYIKKYPNLHLKLSDTIGAIATFDGPIDILHIDAAHEYVNVKRDYELWLPKVRSGGLILLHDTQSDPDNVGKFFAEIEGDKEEIKECNGLGAVFVE